MKQKQWFWGIWLVNIAMWVVIATLSAPSLDSYGDMVENYAWSQTWTLGSFKHPPLFVWMVKLWFMIFPTQVWAYYILSYLNAGLGMLGVVALANLWLPKRNHTERRSIYALMVLVFTLLGLPYANLASKFNADTVLLSLWPWTAYVFFRVLKKEQNSLIWLTLLGFMGALAILGKYYSAVLLLTLGIISISEAQYRTWYRRFSPYYVVLIFIVTLLPHMIWEVNMGFPFQQYLGDKFEGGVRQDRMLSFLLSLVFYWPLTWGTGIVLYKKWRNQEVYAVDLALPIRSLYLLFLLPALITVILHLLIGVHLTTHWAIPIGFALPALLGALLYRYIPESVDWFSGVKRLGYFGLVLMIGAWVYTGILSYKGNPKYALAREEMAQSINLRFAQRYPNQILGWVGGAWSEPGAVAFFSDQHPRAVPSFPDQMPALVNPHPSWSHEYGVILCYDFGHLGQKGFLNDDCEQKTQRWLLQRGLPEIKETLYYQAEGWRYLKPQAKNITVFWVAPQ